MKKAVLFIVFCLSLSLNAQNLSVNIPQTINLNKTYTKLYGYFQSDVTTDNSGHKIMVGGFDGVAVDFGTNDTISSVNNSNIFIVKYDTDNQVVFLKNIGGTLAEGGFTTYANDYATGVKVDAEDNIYVLATIDVSTLETVDLDPEHPETNSIISTSSGSWWTIDQNIFIIKYAPDGTMLWFREIEEAYNDKGFNLLIDNNNDVWVTGVVAGQCDEGADFDTDSVYADNRDMIKSDFFQAGFVAHYNSNGEFINVKGIDNGFITGA